MKESERFGNKKLMVGEREVRNFLRWPMCYGCANEFKKQVYLNKTDGAILMGPEASPVDNWVCPECGTAIQLPTNAFPQMGFQIVVLEGPPEPDGTGN